MQLFPRPDLPTDEHSVERSFGNAFLRFLIGRHMHTQAEILREVCRRGLLSGPIHEDTSLGPQTSQKSQKRVGRLLGPFL